jgi:hypothetical protein
MHLIKTTKSRRREMNKMVFAVIVLMMFVLSAGVSFAGCEDDCNGPFQTCLNLCRQTTKEDSPQGSACVDRCFHGLAGCQNRCKRSGQKSENIRMRQDVVFTSDATDCNR